MSIDSDVVQLKAQMVDLQSQLAFQEDTLQSLNEVIVRQQQQIEHLHELCVSQQSQLEQMASDAEHGAGSESMDRPPHY